MPASIAALRSICNSAQLLARQPLVGQYALLRDTEEKDCFGFLKYEDGRTIEVKT
jgi:hypothetical protein